VNTPWIDGGIQEINGVVKVFVPPDSACYECGMTETDYRLISLRYSCPLLRQEDLLAGKVPTAPTISSIIAGLQSQEALKVIHGMQVAAGRAMVFNGAANQFYATSYQRKEDCLSHETYPEPVELPLSASAGERGNTAAELFAAARNHLPVDGELELQLERDLVVALEGTDGSRKPVMKPLQEVGLDEAKDAATGEMLRPVLEHRIVEGSELAERRLADLGIPPYEIVRLTGDSQEAFFLLGGDRDQTKA
jgi:adenylyltransferase/sulfurtransferase